MLRRTKTIAALAVSALSLADQYGNFTYTVIGGSEIEITRYPPNEYGPVAIPSQIVGLPVTGIGKEAFFFCTGLTNVSIPSSVTSIGDFAFSDCGSLTSVTVPSGVRITLAP